MAPPAKAVLEIFPDGLIDFGRVATHLTKAMHNRHQNVIFPLSLLLSLGTGACGSSDGSTGGTSTAGSSAAGSSAAGSSGGSPSSAGSPTAAGSNNAGAGPSGGTAGSPGSAGSPDATGGTVGASGANSAGTGGSGGSGVGTAGAGGGGTPSSVKFSFFVTSMAALQAVSGNEKGFGGDLRFGETGPGAGLRGADKICTAIAERSMAGNAKVWRAFLSVTDGGNGNPVNAIDRVGSGPWYDRLGRLIANTAADLAKTRPTGADSAIINDLPNEDGLPNHQPDPTQPAVDNHDTLTGSDATGKLYKTDLKFTCNDWTTAEATTWGSPRVGHSWPRSFGGGVPGGGMGSGDSWISALDESGCGAGYHITTADDGPPSQSGTTVGDGGGYGGFYCFALNP